MTAIHSDVNQLADEIRNIIRRWETDHWKHARVGLKTLRLKPNASGLYLHGEKLTYCFSVLFYGAICNRYRQHDIHTFLCGGRLCWGRVVPNIATLAKKPDMLPEETGEYALLALVEEEIAAVKAEHDRFIKEAYAWRLCENVIRGIATLENWSFGKGKIGGDVAGDIRVTGDGVQVLVRSNEMIAENACNLLKACDGQTPHMEIRRNRDATHHPGAECEMLVRLAKGSNAVAAVRRLAEICRPGPDGQPGIC